MNGGLLRPGKSAKKMGDPALGQTARFILRNA